MNVKRTAREYARVGLETGVLAATPHGMILMLFDGALRAVRDADAHLAAQRVAAKGQAISRAIAIVDEGLRRSLDCARGGAVARQLNDLYDYVVRRLLAANVGNDRATLAEVTALLSGLRGAWAAIDDDFAAASPSLLPTAA